MRKWNDKIILLVILVLAASTFFYRLGQSSLVSWDEAWYGQIAKNILHTGDLFHLTFNGQPYADHPPAGFWLIAGSMQLFGITETGVRTASAIFGLFTIVVTYLIGKRLFHPSVGLAAGLALISSPWFALRSRSGDLDIFLTFFFVLTFYLALLVGKNRRVFPLFLASLVLLFLTKSVVPFTILPVLFYFSLTSWHLPLKYYFSAGFVLVAALIAWLLYPSGSGSPGVAKYFQIGLPSFHAKTEYLSNLALTKSYIHYGIGTWFRPAIISILPALFFPSVFLPLIIFVVSFTVPFIFSPKGQIWHLIPLHPFLILIFTGCLYTVLVRLRLRRLAPLLTILLTLFIAVPQLNRNWTEFIDISAFVSDEAILSRAAKSYPESLIIDESFAPAAVFYSDKHVFYDNRPSLQAIFNSDRPFLLITHSWRLSRDGIDPSAYRLLKSDRDRVLLLKL